MAVQYKLEHEGFPYLKIDPENFILLEKCYFQYVPEYDESKITRKPSKLKRLLYTFVIK